MLEITYFGAAAVAGLLSFLSPCILPIFPFYLSYLAGVGINQISAEAEIAPKMRARAVLAACCFAAGVIITMGLHFLRVLRIGVLYRQLRADTGNTTNVSFAGSYVIGLAFAFGWTPCVGPVLAAILFMAAGADMAGAGAGLLFVYGAGMTAPFILAASFISPFMRWMVKVPQLP